LVETKFAELSNIHGDALVVMSGMAEGFDKCLAIAALNMGIRLWCAIPNKGYSDYYWKRHSLTGEDQSGTFFDIIRKAWRITYVMEEVHNVSAITLNGKHSNFWRNDFMVEKADEFLVYDIPTPGTQQCFKTIKASGKPFTVIR